MIVKINCELCFLINLFIHAVNVLMTYYVSGFLIGSTDRVANNMNITIGSHGAYILWKLKISISHSLLAIPRLSLDS